MAEEFLTALEVIRLKLMNIEFKELRNQDLALMYEWLQRPHVKMWWNDGDDTLEKVQKHYTSNPDTTKRFILFLDDKTPIGYFQYYNTPRGVGIDQFLSDGASLDKGLGTRCVRQFVRMIAERHNPPVIMVDPSPDNKRAIRCYEKVGFKPVATVSGQDGKMVYMMEIVPKDLVQPV